MKVPNYRTSKCRVLFLLFFYLTLVAEQRMCVSSIRALTLWTKATKYEHKMLLLSVKVAHRMKTINMGNRKKSRRENNDNSSTPSPPTSQLTILPIAKLQNKRLLVCAIPQRQLCHCVLKCEREFCWMAVNPVDIVHVVRRLLWIKCVSYSTDISVQ